MPAPALYSLAQQAGVSVSKAEEYWDKAKTLAADEGKAEDYAYITGIVKKMLGLSESGKPQLVDFFSRRVELLEVKDESSPQLWKKPYLAKVKSTLMEFDKQNQNGRTYNTRIAEKIKNSAKLKQRLEMRALVAQGNHPKEGLETDINKIGGVVTEWNFTPDNRVMEGTIEVLNTSTGRDIYELLRAGIPVGVSARGYGDVDHHGNVLEESYELLTFDLVIDPSFESAITKVQEIMERYSPKNLKLTEVTDIMNNQSTEDLKTMFENTEIKRINMEDAYFDLNVGMLKKIDEDKNFITFLEYAKSYINEIASQYFVSEKLFSVDYSKFWNIVESVISKPSIYEIPVLFEKTVLQTINKEELVDSLNRYVIAVLNEYNKIVRKSQVKLEENYLFKYLRLVAKTSHLIEASDVMSGLDNTKEDSMDNDVLKKKRCEANDEEEFVIADFDDDEDMGDEAPAEEEIEVDEPEEEDEEITEQADTPEEGDYRFYDEDEFVDEATEVDGMDVEKLEKPVNDEALVDDAEAPKPQKAKSVEGAESTTPKETEGSEKTGMEPITVAKVEARKLARKHGISIREGAVLLMAQQIIEKKIDKKGKKPAVKKKTAVVVKKKKVKESVERPVAKKEPTKIQSIQEQKKVLNEDSEKTLNLCMKMFRG